MATGAVAKGHTRTSWLALWGRDVLTLGGASAIATVSAVVWMLARTDRGRYDLGTGDAVLAFSMFAAAAPAWSAWEWLTLRRRVVMRRRAGAATRLWLLTALHPAMLPLWLWATAMLLVTGVELFGLLSALPFTMFLTGGALMGGSVLLLLARPSAAPLHEWFARASFGGRR